MPTPILKVITEYCDVYVDDINLQSLKTEDMPLYARKMWGYLRPSIPLFNHPSDMPIYLLGTVENPTLIEPKIGSYQYAAQTELTSDTTVELGEDFQGYELFCCRIQQTDYFGNIIMLPTNAVTYNAETGQITIAASVDAPIPAGTVFDMDFYTDGAFAHTLSPEIMQILGICFQEIWQDRFNTDWLSMVSKIDDRSFTEQNRANKVRADTERLIAIRTKRAEAMRRYENNLAFRKAFPEGSGLIP